MEILLSIALYSPEDWRSSFPSIRYKISINYITTIGNGQNNRFFKHKSINHLLHILQIHWLMFNFATSNKG